MSLTAEKVDRWDRAKDGGLDEDRLRAKIEKQGYPKINRQVFPPTAEFPNHTHPVDKMQAVLSGRLRITTPNGRIVLGPGDMLLIPTPTRHSAEVLGATPVVSLEGEVLPKPTPIRPG